MKTSLMLAAVIVLTALNTYAQSSDRTPQKEVYREEFNSAGKWYVGQFDASTLVDVNNGRYRIAHTDTSNFVYFYETVVLDFTKNWSIETVVRQESGDTKHGYGLVFATADVNNLYEFIVTADGYYRVNRFKEGEYVEFAAWKQHPAVKQNADNVLLVRKVNDDMAFLVNGVQIYSLTASYYNMYGNRMGFCVHGDRTVTAEHLIVKQWEPDPISVVEGAKEDEKLVNLGRAVNDTSSDIVDCISADGSVLVFSRTYHPGNVPPTDKRDIWMSTRNDDGSWNRAVSMGQPINNASQNFAVTISPDLNTVVLQNQYTPTGEFGGPGLSISNRTKDGWEVPTNISVDNMVNEASLTSTHVSPDGQVFVTSIQTPSSFGNVDLYVCFRRENGTWTEPKNLGSLINTQGMEYAPFIAGDGRTLYFASNGLPGYGGADIFVTRRLDDTWLKWSKPLNLGKGINSDEHDAFLYVPAKGDSAYFSSTKNSIGRDDVFSVALVPAARPEPVILVRGRVLHALTKQPLEASVRYEVLPGGRQAGLARSNPSTGKYAVALPAGELYGVRAEAPGYYPLSEQFSTKALSSYAEIERDLFLVPIADGAVVRLNNVFFDFGKHDLREESHPELDRLALFLKANPAMSIELGGHTDNVGEDAANRTLSQNRVNSVMTYLTSKSIPAGRLKAKGYGESKPVATNDTEEGRQQNRRVEFTILKK